MNKLYLIFTMILIALTGCSPPAQHTKTPAPPENLPAPQENPQWINQLIDQFQSEPVGNPPQSIWRYEYKGQIVYFVPQQCCDRFSTLYDADGNEICAPDGGFVGKGDGKCPDFRTERTAERLVWQDTRTR